MRNYKFRGWDEEHKQWVYGYYTKLVEGIRRFDAIITDVDGELVRFYIHDPKSIGEYSGVNDIDGNELYEKDVVSSLHWNPQRQEITFDRGGFCLKYDDSEYYPDIKYAEEMTRIGNTYENSTILKE